MNQIDAIRTLAASLAAHRGISESRVSTLVFNDGKRISSISSGADMGVRSAIRALQWFSDNWPADLEWPQEIERPAPAEGAAA